MVHIVFAWRAQQGPGGGHWAIRMDWHCLWYTSGRHGLGRGARHFPQESRGKTGAWPGRVEFVQGHQFLVREQEQEVAPSLNGSEKIIQDNILSTLVT